MVMDRMDSKETLKIRYQVKTKLKMESCRTFLSEKDLNYLWVYKKNFKQYRQDWKD